MGIIGIDLFEVLFTLVFLFVLAVFVLTLVRGCGSGTATTVPPG